MGLKSLLAAVLLLFLTAVGLLSYAVASMDIEELILCASDDGGFSIPAPMCKSYLLNFRGTEEDINVLEAGAGLAYALSAPGTTDRFEISRFLIEQGLDVNSRNHYTSLKLTPLHSAVLDNDAAAVSFLLENGADRSARTVDKAMTPLEFAELLEAKDPATDRSAVVAAFES